MESLATPLQKLKTSKSNFFFLNSVHSFWLEVFTFAVTVISLDSTFHKASIYIYLHLLTDTVNISVCATAKLHHVYLKVFFVDPNGTGSLQCCEVQSIFVVGCA
jgi:hypothetical protein